MRRWDGPITAQALGGVFVALTMILVLVMAPLSLVVAGRAEAAGLTAASVSGTVWRGRLGEAAFGGVRLGDVQIGVSPLALLAAKISLGFEGEALRGGLSLGPRRTRLRDVDADLPLASLAPDAGLIGRVRLRDFGVALRGGQCQEAEGAVALDQLSLVGLDLPGLSLNGSPACAGADLVIPLSGQAEGVDVAGDLRISPGGAYRMGLTVRTTRPEVDLALGAAGAQQTLGGRQMQVAGRLGVS